MALELSCLDMELLLSFSTPVDNSKEETTGSTSTTQIENRSKSKNDSETTANNQSLNNSRIPDVTTDTSSNQLVNSEVCVNNLRYFLLKKPNSLMLVLSNRIL